VKAVLGRELGPPENYALVDMAVPVLGDGELLVRVEAVGVSYADVLVAAGKYQVRPPTPYIPGSELAGIVEEASPQTGFSVGDRVCGTLFGGAFAEIAVLPVSAVFAAPAALSFQEAAVLPGAYGTAYHALVQRAQLQPGETLFVLGAGGGVGYAAVEVGRLLGARVIAGASTAAKRALALRGGAEAVVDTSLADWRARLKELAGDGLNVVFDPIGDGATEPAFRSLAWGGRHLVIGFAGGNIPALRTNLPLLKGSALIGVDVRQFGIHEPRLAAANMRQIFVWAGGGRLHPPIGPRYPLARFADAMNALSNREVIGRVIIVPNQSD
jgi:NADPH2:quinone reductase